MPVSDNEFRQMSSDLAEIKANIRQILSEHTACREQVNRIDKESAVNEDSLSSAHKRISELKHDMLWMVTESTVIATIIMNILTWGLGKVLK